MAVFYNRAALTYNGEQILSNRTEGELLTALGLSKTAISGSYEPGGTVTYAVTVVNSGEGSYTGLSLSDDLGAYATGPDGTEVTPLSYRAGTLRVFIDGALQAAEEPAEPLVIEGIDLPAGASAVIVYETEANSFAPPAAGGTVTNTVTLTGPGLAEPLTAEATVSAVTGADLTILKELSPDTVSPGQEVSYTFTILNSGNEEASAGLILRDTFEPALSGISVTVDGQAAGAGMYSYDEATGVFETAEGTLTVPAAAYSQDVGTFEYTADPGETVVTVTGTI